MIISEEIELVLGIKNHTFLKKKYNLSESLKPGDLVMVPLGILNKSSHFLVDVSCDYCGLSSVFKAEISIAASSFFKAREGNKRTVLGLASPVKI